MSRDPSPDFWPTVAQLLPVLALALIIETRELRKAPVSSLAASMYFLFVTPVAAVLLGVAEYIAVAVLAGGMSAPSWAPDFVLAAVAVSLTLLIVNPAVEALAATSFSAAVLARLMTKLGILRWRARRNERRLDKLRAEKALLRRRVEMLRQTARDAVADETDPKRREELRREVAELEATMPKAAGGDGDGEDGGRRPGNDERA